MSNVTKAPLSPEIAKQLEQLKDIHLPEPISWWPLAWGWWGVILLIILVIVSLIVSHVRRRIYRSVLAELDEISHHNPTAQSQALSTLFKRVGLYRGRHIESLSGKAWADYLEQYGFNTEQAEFIAFASYTPPENYTAPEWSSLQKNAKRWIKQQFKQRGGK